MPVFRNESNGTWYVMARYVDWQGNHKQKCKRGFKTKREALEWERVFHLQQSADMDMSFESFVDIYKNDIRSRIKETTWLTKVNIIDKKILPYFGKRKISEIQTKEVIAWQNDLLQQKDKTGKPYSECYLKTIHNQLSAIFNHAVRFYALRTNPAAKAGNMGSEKRKEMLFWTKEEYLRFADVMMDKPVSYYAFEMLYWCGLRLGELLALTPSDFDFQNSTVTINKSYQRLKEHNIEFCTYSADVTFPKDIDKMGKDITHTALLEISDVKGVCALAPTKSLNFGLGLNIVYGENGCGKSSYVKILKKAQDPKSSINIFGNVYSEGEKTKPSANLVFDYDGIKSTDPWSLTR